MGGIGKIRGIVIGVLLLRLIFVGLNMASVNQDLIYLVKGGIILFACALDMRKVSGQEIIAPDFLIGRAVTSGAPLCQKGETGGMLERWSGIWYNGRESGHGKGAPAGPGDRLSDAGEARGPWTADGEGADGMERYQVLLVDDEEEIRAGDQPEDRLGQPGLYPGGGADNGEEALELAELVRPDVVLTDIKMPFMDGLELCRRLEADPACRQDSGIFRL